MHLKKYLKKADIVLMTVLLLAGLLSLFFSGRSAEGSAAGGFAVARQAGIEIGRFPLDRDGIYALDGDWGHHSIEIKDGQARMYSADCGGGDCLRMGPVSRGGEAIVCLPHRLSITVEASARELDSVSW